MSERVILHSDLNNYYASVECMLNPSLKDKYIAVCGKQEDRHGIVLAKNQKAKLCGVSTGETIWQAREKCPELTVVSPHFGEYIKYSKLVKQIYYRYTDMIEPFGLDECWLDVTGSKMLFGSGEEIADRIRRGIKKELNLTVSVGVSFNKVFAKLASDMKKPDAVTVISKENFKSKAWPLPAGDILGVGRATRRALALKSIYTIGDIARRDISLMKAYLGANGEKLWYWANGLDLSPVREFGSSPAAKSVGHGITCTEDLFNPEEVKHVLIELAQGVSHRLRESGLSAGGVHLSVKDNSLCTLSMQGNLLRHTQSFKELTARAMELFNEKYDWKKPVRALSITAINLSDSGLPIQQDIFSDPRMVQKNESIEIAMERIQNRYGRRSIRIASCMHGLKMPLQNFDETLVMPKYCGS